MENESNAIVPEEDLSNDYENSFEFVTADFWSELEPEPTQADLIKNLDNPNATIVTCTKQVQELERKVEYYEKVTEEQSAEILQLQKRLADEKVFHSADCEIDDLLIRKLKKKLQQYKQRILNLQEENSKQKAIIDSASFFCGYGKKAVAYSLYALKKIYNKTLSFFTKNDAPPEV